MLFLTSATADALTVDPGGPWRLAEGGTLTLRPIVSNVVGDVEYAWDIDGDGVFDDGGEATADLSAQGIDGPSEGFTVGLVVADDVDQTLVEIPVDITNAPPVFTNDVPSRAVIGRPWTWTPVVTDPGNDPVELSVQQDTLPNGMLWDALLMTFTWQPNEGHLLLGEPPGTYTFRVTAQDEDNARTNYDAIVTVVRNTPPPVPPIVYPTDQDDVQTSQPTIILTNVDDEDGDPVTYWLQVDTDPCFCTSELQEVLDPGVPEGEFATQWRLPRPLEVVLGDDPKTYYVQRWTNDGIEDSDQELSLFKVQLVEGGGDADSDADSDADADTDVDADGDDGGGGRDRGGCAAAPGVPSAPLAALAAIGALLALSRRRRQL